MVKDKTYMLFTFALLATVLLCLYHNSISVRVAEIKATEAQEYNDRAREAGERAERAAESISEESKRVERITENLSGSIRKAEEISSRTASGTVEAKKIIGQCLEVLQEIETQK